MPELALTAAGPHDGQPVYTAGAALSRARAAMIMLHGRGASAWDILGLAEHLDGSSFAFLAPQAAEFAWYPNRFMQPTASNEPWLSSALAGVGFLVEQAGLAGIPAGRIMLLGFSQGACLALEFAARGQARLGAVAGLSGGLIGPEGALFPYPGGLDGLPVLLGCSDSDPHIPKSRVLESAAVFRSLGAQVDCRLYPNFSHSVNNDELQAVHALMERLLEPTGGNDHN